MDKFGKSQSTSRVEDQRFLTGQGRYVDDIVPEEALVAFVFRSPVAHAVITELDVSDAAAMDGVKLILTSQDLIDAGVSMDLAGMTIKNRDGSNAAAPARPLLAHGKVRHVGEPIAFILAETLEQAKDAAEAIIFDFEELDTHLALDIGGAEIHEGVADNLAFDWAIGDQDGVDEVFKTAAKVVSLEVGDNRVIVNSLEPRGCYAEWDGSRLHLSVNGQGVWNQKNRLQQMLNLTAEQIRVTNPDVGGGFGMKAMTYPEYYLASVAAMQLATPVRWMSERTEAMLSDNAGRDLVSIAEFAFDADHKIQAYRVHTVCNLGAYNSQFGQGIQTQLFSRVLMGTYDVQKAYLSVRGVYTNTTQVDAYRGAGRPEAIYVLERLMDRAARELGVDPIELRRRNFIDKSAFPYKSVTGETYDVGDFHLVLDHAVQSGDVAGFASRKQQSAAQGKLRGIGTCFYIESILGDPSETARVEFNDDGSVFIYVGTQSNGQGHETVYAKFLSDQTGIPFEQITVIQGDSDRIAKGGGTGGSRSVTTQNTATLATVSKMIESFGAYLADKFEVTAEDIQFDDERFRIAGSNETPTMLEVAEMVRNQGRDDLLVHEQTTTLPGRSFPNGAHIAEVEIDKETGQVTLAKYTVVDDFGNLINPMLAAGQVHGGIAQGAGQALMEHVAFDESGQLLTATFMDYAMPRASDMPMINLEFEPVPSTANLMGMKGCGEAGTVGSMGAVANAVQDALWDLGVTQADMPFTPHRVWQMMNRAARS